MTLKYFVVTFRCCCLLESWLSEHSWYFRLVQDVAWTSPVVFHLPLTDLKFIEQWQEKKTDISSFFVHKATNILCNKLSSCALANALFGSGCARTMLFLEYSCFSCHPWGAVLVDFLYDSLMYMAHCLANLFFSSRMLNALHPLELYSYWLVSSHHFTWVVLYLEKWHELSSFFFFPVILNHCSLYIVCCSVILLVFFAVFFTFWCRLLSASVLSWRQQLVSFIVHIFLPHQAVLFIGSSADVSSSRLQSCGIVGFMRLQWLVTATCSV